MLYLLGVDDGVGGEDVGGAAEEALDCREEGAEVVEG